METIEEEEKKSQYDNQRYCDLVDFGQISYIFAKESKAFKSETTTLQEQYAFYICRLLTSTKFHGLNIWKKEKELQKIVEQDIILKSRQPLGHPQLEGLRLLSAAWDYEDKTKLDADAYAVISRNIVRFQLFLVLLITILTMFGFQLSQNSDKNKANIEVLKYFTLGASLFLSGSATLDSLIALKTMWRQLRKYSILLESLIWKYRTRVVDFRTTLATTYEAEEKFSSQLNEWKDDLHRALQNIAGTMIPGKTRNHMTTSLSIFTVPNLLRRLFRREVETNRTSHKKVKLEKNNKKEDRMKVIFNTHLKKKNEEANSKNYVDDHYSYIEPEEYVSLRLHGLIRIYQNRLLDSVWRQKVWDLTIIFLGIVISPQ